MLFLIPFFETGRQYIYMRKRVTLNHKIHHTCMTCSDMLSIMVVSLEAV